MVQEPELAGEDVSPGVGGVRRRAGNRSARVTPGLTLRLCYSYAPSLTSHSSEYLKNLASFAETVHFS